MKIKETNKIRTVCSKDYNTYFNKETGYFLRWGETTDDDPKMACMPEIADIEISSGKCHNNCSFCYKKNKAKGKLHNMTFKEFRDIFFKIANTTLCVIYPNGKKCEYNIADGDFRNFKGNMFDTYENLSRKEIRTKKEFIDTFISQYKTTDLYKTLQIKIYNKGLLNQIAFGITSPLDNPDFFEMMKFAREFDVIPNYTIKASDLTDEIVDKTIETCGACAISLTNKEETLHAANKLLKKGFKQTNLHVVAMQENFNIIKELIKDYRTNNINAIVLLKYKPKGTNAGKFKALTKEQYNEIFNLAEKYNVGIGFDSCSAPIYLDMVKDKEKAIELSQYAEPCESTLFSIYVNSHGYMFPCSFSEEENRNEENWLEGLNILTCKDFKKDIWFNKRTQSFRQKLLENKRHCPIFNLEE